MKPMTWLMLMTIPLASCGMNGVADGCAGWKPIRLDAQTIDHITERDARDILAHNEAGVIRGCW